MSLNDTLKNIAIGTKDFLIDELPNYLIIAAICSGTTFAALKYSDQVRSYLSVPKIVTFDVIKFNSAQKRVTGFLTKNQDSDMIVTIQNLGKNTQKSIRKFAGDNAIIVVKQAVISTAKVEDITDLVLVDLGLPTDVPTRSLPSAVTGSDDFSLENVVADSVKENQLSNINEKLPSKDGLKEQNSKVLPWE